MNNSNQQLNFSSVFVILLMGCMFVLIYTKESIFESVKDLTGEVSIAEAETTTNEVSKLLLSLGNIQFDTNVLNSKYLDNLIPFADFPVDAQTLANFGKTNPFLGSFSVATEMATGTSGGLIYSSQRQPLNNGSAIRSVPSGNTNR